MTRRLRFDPEARAELDEAALRYDRQTPGVGDAFAAAVRDTIEAVLEWPGLGAPVSERRGGTLRQIRVHRFPYHVGYVVTDEELRVVAIAHERRKPGYWTSRL